MTGVSEAADAGGGGVHRPALPLGLGLGAALRGLRAALAGRVRWRRVYRSSSTTTTTRRPIRPPRPPGTTRLRRGDHRAHPCTPGGPAEPGGGELWPASLVGQAAEAQGPRSPSGCCAGSASRFSCSGEPPTPRRRAVAASGRAGPGPGPAGGRRGLGRRTASAVRADRPRRGARSARCCPCATAPRTPGGQGDPRRRVPLRAADAAVPRPPACRAVPGWRSHEQVRGGRRSCGRAAPGAGGAASPAALVRGAGPSPESDRPGAPSADDGGVAAAARCPGGTGNGPLWLHPDEAATHPASGRVSPAEPYGPLI